MAMYNKISVVAWTVFRGGELGRNKYKLAPLCPVTFQNIKCKLRLSVEVLQDSNSPNLKPWEHNTNVFN